MGRERHDGNRKQEQDVDPGKAAVGAGEVVELRLLANPENTKRDKAHQVRDELGSETAQSGAKFRATVNGFAGRNAQIKHQKRHGDGEDSVAQSGETLHALAGNGVICSSYRHRFTGHGFTAKESNRSSETAQTFSRTMKSANDSHSSFGLSSHATSLAFGMEKSLQLLRPPACRKNVPENCLRYGLVLTLCYKIACERRRSNDAGPTNRCDPGVASPLCRPRRSTTFPTSVRTAGLNCAATAASWFVKCAAFI